MKAQILANNKHLLKITFDDNMNAISSCQIWF